MFFRTTNINLAPPARDVARYLTNREVLWDGSGQLASHHLLPKFYKLWMVVGNTIQPTMPISILMMPCFFTTLGNITTFAW